MKQLIKLALLATVLFVSTNVLSQEKNIVSSDEAFEKRVDSTYQVHFVVTNVGEYRMYEGKDVTFKSRFRIMTPLQFYGTRQSYYFGSYAYDFKPIPQEEDWD